MLSFLQSTKKGCYESTKKKLISEGKPSFCLFWVADTWSILLIYLIYSDIQQSHRARISVFTANSLSTQTRMQLMFFRGQKANEWNVFNIPNDGHHLMYLVFSLVGIPLTWTCVSCVFFLAFKVWAATEAAGTAGRDRRRLWPVHKQLQELRGASAARQQPAFPGVGSCRRGPLPHRWLQ